MPAILAVCRVGPIAPRGRHSRRDLDSMDGFLSTHYQPETRRISLKNYHKNVQHLEMRIDDLEREIDSVKRALHALYRSEPQGSEEEDEVVHARRCGSSER
jgi:hypothetical protein